MSWVSGSDARFRKRQYIRLRRITDDILVKIRYLNQIAISVHGGLLDEEARGRKSS
jgi:hypothetical protein